MSGTEKIVWAGIIIVIAALAVVAEFIPALDTGVALDRYTTNSGELTRDTLVGQTFTAERDGLAGVSIMFATYSGRNNTEPVKFHLRSSSNSSENIRTAEVLPSELGDNQLYTFRFEPIPDSANKQYFFFVVSPTSQPGNAVTVDLDTRDPYHLGSAYVVRGQGPAVTNPQVLERSGKPTQDVAFALQYKVSLRQATVNQTYELAHTFVSNWRTNPGAYTSYLWGAGAALVVVLTLIVVQQRIYARLTNSLGKSAVTIIGLLLFMVLGFIFRVHYAIELPVTNDEGNYLYDARSLQQGVLAGGDGYVKSPLVIGWIALWQIIFGNTVLAGRLSVIVAGVLTTIPIYLFTREVWSSKAITHAWLSNEQTASSAAGSQNWGRRIGLVAAALWAVLGGSVVSDIYVHTQPLALLFAVSGLAVLFLALRGTTPTADVIPIRQAASARWFVLAGILLGLGVASRKSILALGLVALALILLEGKAWKARAKHVTSVGIGFLLVVAIFLGVAQYTYGTQGVWEAVGINSADDGINAVEPEEEDQVRAYSIRGMTPFFRENLPLVVLSAFGFGFAVEYAIRFLFTKIPTVPYPHVVARLGWITAWGLFAWMWQFFFEYEGAPFMRYGIEELWWAFGGLLTIALLWPDTFKRPVPVAKQEILIPVSTQPGFHGRQALAARQDEESRYWPSYASAVLSIPLWVGGLIIFYINWIKFHANYISEFIPPLTILGAFGLVALYRRLTTHLFWDKDHPILNVLRKILIVGSIGVVCFAIIVSNHVTYTFEHTGTFHQAAVNQAVAWARDNIPADEPIFTGAALIPYLSGHNVSLHIAHPRWYAYQFTRENTERLNTFLPPITDMLQAYREADWFLLEQQTGFSFLMEYSEIEGGLARDWEKVHEVENGGNPLTFYRRIR